MHSHLNSTQFSLLQANPLDPIPIQGNLLAVSAYTSNVSGTTRVHFVFSDPAWQAYCDVANCNSTAGYQVSQIQTSSRHFTVQAVSGEVLYTLFDPNSGVEYRVTSTTVYGQNNTQLYAAHSGFVIKAAALQVVGTQSRLLLGGTEASLWQIVAVSTTGACAPKTWQGAVPSICQRLAETRVIRTGDCTSVEELAVIGNELVAVVVHANGLALAQSTLPADVCPTAWTALDSMSVSVREQVSAAPSFGGLGEGSGSGSGAPGPSPGKAVTGSAALSILPQPPTAP